MKTTITTIFGLFLGIIHTFAQTIDASPETQTICAGASATLSAVVTPAGPSGSLPTDSYAISSIPYAPDPLTAGTSVTLTDDSQTGLIPIGFSFCYFGNTYTDFVIGSNNWIGFQTGETSTWVTTAIPNASGTAPRNTIMGAWQDINPGIGGTVKYAVYGVPPFRRLAVSWNNVPMFSCTGQLYSSQIIIYETTNIIETHIANKSLCLTWNSGNAVHGLHNSTGTVAFVVPGRNNTQWTVANEATRFTPDGVITYTINWYILPANTLVGTGSPITVTPPTSPQLYYAEVLSNSCTPVVAGTNTDTVEVITDNVPVDAGAYTTFCSGESITLSATAPTGVGFSWSPPGSLSNAAILNPVATPGGTTTYTLSVTDGLGCVGTDTVTLAMSNLIASAGSNVAICLGSSTTLTATGGTSYSWSPALGLSNPAIANPVANPTVTTTYTVTAIQGVCTSTSTVTVTVNPLPVVDAGAAASMCIGGTTTLLASGATSYVWSPSATLSSAVVANPTSNATTTTTYTVVGTDGNGCSSTDNITLTVNPLPTIDAGASISICPGTSTTLNATGGSTYVWSPAASLDNPTIANPVSTPSSLTTYTVVGTDVNGCSSTDVVTISLSGVVVTASTASATVCSGSNTTLSALGAATYSWSPSATLSSSTSANPVASPTTTTTYTVIGTAAAGCLDTAFVTVTVNPLPTITVGPAASICLGSTTTLSASGAVGYSWSPVGSLTGASTATPVSSTAASITYTVVGTDANGCTSSNTVNVTVNALPVATSTTSAASVCSGTPVTLTATGGGTYSWSPSGSLSSSTIASPTATPAVTTTYTVTVTNAAGCTATSTVMVTVNPIPVATASADVVICNGASTVLTATGGGTYFWSPGAGLSSVISATPTASPTTTTTYTVVVSNGSCTSTADVIVTVNNTLSLASGTTTDATCGNTDGTITAGAVTGGGAPFTYSLNGGPGQTSTTFTGVASGTYTLTVTDGAGCSATQTVTVNSVLGVNAAFSASPMSGSSPLTVDLTNGSNGASNYLWNFDNGSGSVLTNPSTVYNANGSYTITLIAYNGSFACADTASITIEVFDQAQMLIPNVFTPNGDLHNDVFFVTSIGIKEMTGTIYNRWGKIVGEWNGVTSGWDGKVKGKDAEDGTYYYVIKATGYDSKTYDATGFVELLTGTK